MNKMKQSKVFFADVAIILITHHIESASRKFFPSIKQKKVKKKKRTKKNEHLNVLKILKLSL